MITIILIIIAWNTVMSVFNLNTNYLACGLIGFAPKGNKKGNIDWLKLIMCYNIARGTDSCGIFINDGLIKGVKTESNIMILLAKNPVNYDEECDNRVVIAHTRKSTRGKNEEKNAHPFWVEKEDGSRAICLAHNGTITNIDELAKKYEVDTTGLEVDSNILAKIIVERGYDVLKDYQGTAALLFTYSDEPNVLYAFKGASKNYAYEKLLTEERPLYCIENENGRYFSSLEEPLNAVSDQTLDIVDIDINTVFRFENDSFEEIAHIERDNSNIIYTRAVVQHTPRNNTHAHNNNVSHGNHWDDWDSHSVGETARIGRQIEMFNKDKEITYNVKEMLIARREIYEEAFPTIYQQKPTLGMVYYMAGRYYYFNEPKDLESFEDPTRVTAETPGIEKYLMNGVFSVIDIYTNYKYSKASKISSDLEEIQNNTSKNIHAFFEGVLLSPKKIAKFIKKDIGKRLSKMTHIFNKTIELSSYSQWPITMLFSESNKLKSGSITWYKEGKEINFLNAFAPHFSIRHYTINASGMVTCIRSSFNGDRIFHSDQQVPVVETEVTTEDTTPSGVPETKTIFSLPGGYNFTRFVKIGETDERIIVDEEAFHGIADCNYYLDPDYNNPISGSQIERDAIINWLNSSNTLTNDKNNNPELEWWVNKVIDEGYYSGQGLLGYMKTTWGIDFKIFIEEALTNTAFLMEDPDYQNEDSTSQELDEIIEKMHIGQASSSASSFKEDVGNEGFENIVREIKFKKD